MSQNLTDLGSVALRRLADHFEDKPVPTSGDLQQSGAPWSPAKIQTVQTGPLINLATTPVDRDNVDDRYLWGNRGRDKIPQ